MNGLRILLGFFPHFLDEWNSYKLYGLLNFEFINHPKIEHSCTLNCANRWTHTNFSTFHAIQIL
jgi:hypothetical protein